MRTMDVIDRYVVGRDDNVIHVDFGQEPDPPAPRFPGAASSRVATVLSDTGDAFALQWAAPNCCVANGDSIVTG
jgi:hypothetical protein